MRRRGARIALLATAVLGLTLLGAELGLRALLFSASPAVRKQAWRLRQPQLYADPHTDVEHWKLAWALGRGGETRPSVPDALLGWRSDSVDAEGRHASVGPDDPRRPVLLFGDSFAACTTPPEDCFQGLLAESDLGDELVLVNYGVGGYGLDQIYLLLREALPHWEARDPVVVVALFVDDDLDRARFAFRDWPKPRFRLEGEELVLEPPAAPDNAAWLEEHPLAIRSYLWRWIARALAGSRPARTTDEAHARLCEALLGAIQDELTARDLDAFFLLFVGERALEAGCWSETFLRRELAALGLPWEEARGDLEADALATGRERGAYFVDRGPDAGHYDALGNEVAFRTLRRGLEALR